MARNRHMTLSALLQSVLPPHAGFDRLDNVIISGMSQDSRRIRPGDLFFAVPGATHDGRRYIADAIASGAVAVLVEDEGDAYSEQGWTASVPVVAVQKLRQRIGDLASSFFGLPSRQVPVIGVTGTNGKTSLTHYIAQLLEGLGRRCGVVGTLGCGIFPSLTDSGYTTPDAVTLQATLAELVDAGADCVAMEVSSQGIDQFRVSGVEFHSAVFTNLTRDHLDYHESMEAYASAKRKLFSVSALRFGIVNVDDQQSASMLAALPATSESVTYGLGAGLADIRVTSSKAGENGLVAHIVSPWGEATVTPPLWGRFNLANVLAAVAAVMTLPLPIEFPAVAAQASRLSPVSGRMQRIGGASGFAVFVDYAHTPDGLHSALSALKEHAHGRLWCIFGCGGERDRGKRPLMAQVAERWADRIIVTDDNPRHENGDSIVNEILAGFTHVSEPEVVVERDRRAAIERAIFLAQAGDVVLIAGKGHEAYQEVAGQRYAFNDAEHAGQVLVKRHQLQSEQGGVL